MMVIISKNEIWPNMIDYLEEKKIPRFLIGYKIKNEKLNNWLIKKYYLKYIPKFSHVFTQDKFTYTFLTLNNIPHCSMVGDIRINQVLNDAKITLEDPVINALTQNSKKTITYGSVEKKDYPIVVDFINSRDDLNHIIIPHDITDVQDLRQVLSSPHILYSEKENKKFTNSNIVVVDFFGILKHIYQYSDIAYIGGGFSHGVHNTLEPAVHGNYMLFGPKHRHFPETHFFIKNQVANVISSKEEFENVVNKYLEKNPSKNIIINTIEDFLNKNKQDLKNIISLIKKHLN